MRRFARPAAILGVAWFGIALCGCRDHRQTRTTLRLTLGRERVLARFGQSITAATGHPRRGRFAAGTATGEILIAATGGATASLTARAHPKCSTARGDCPPVSVTHDGAVVSLSFAGDALASAGGSSVFWWNVETRRLVNRVAGPDGVKAVEAPGDGTVIFGTSRGHLLRWRVSTSEAKPLDGLSCQPALVPPERRHLPPARRCRVGSYIRLQERQLCLFSVDALAHRGARVARACREGTVAMFAAKGGSRRWCNVAGAVAALSFIDSDRVVFAREDGLIRVWDFSRNRIDMERGPVRLQAAAKITAVDANENLIAVAAGKSILLWRLDATEPIGRIPAGGRVLWMQLRGKEPRLDWILSDGSVLSRRLAIEETPSGVSSS